VKTFVQGYFCTSPRPLPRGHHRAATPILRRALANWVGSPAGSRPRATTVVGTPAPRHGANRKRREDCESRYATRSINVPVVDQCGRSVPALRLTGFRSTRRREARAVKTPDSQTPSMGRRGLRGTNVRPLAPSIPAFQRAWIGKKKDDGKGRGRSVKPEIGSWQDTYDHATMRLSPACRPISSGEQWRSDRCLWTSLSP
jgi:hypothetical protein